MRTSAISAGLIRGSIGGEICRLFAIEEICRSVSLSDRSYEAFRGKVRSASAGNGSLAPSSERRTSTVAESSTTPDGGVNAKA
jgi:hypothetical protein